MTTLRPYKFQLVATVQELDDDGDVVAEATIQQSQQPITVYGVQGLIKWAEGFPADLEEMSKERASETGSARTGAST